jgi:hypothetical protein
VAAGGGGGGGEISDGWGIQSWLDSAGGNRVRVRRTDTDTAYARKLYEDSVTTALAIARRDSVRLDGKQPTGSYGAPYDSASVAGTAHLARNSDSLGSHAPAYFQVAGSYGSPYDSATVSASTHALPDSNTTNPTVISATRFRGALIGNASGSSGSCAGQAATVATIAGLTADTTAGGSARATLAANATNLGGRAAARYDTLPTVLDSTLPLRADGVAARPVGIFYETDFLYRITTNTTTNFPWYSLAISSGTEQPVSGFATHPGIARVFSSTGANSGFYSMVGVTSFLLAGSEVTGCVVRFDTMTASTCYFGFHNATSATRPTNGCFFIISGTTARGYNFATSGDSTASTYGLTKFCWYWLNVRIRSDAGMAYYTIKDSVGALVFSDSLGTKIPTTSGKETGQGIVVTNSGTTAYPLIDLDYMNLRIARKISAGRPN